jgi:Phosphate-selective porin O and P
MSTARAQQPEVAAPPAADAPPAAEAPPPAAEPPLPPPPPEAAAPMALPPPPPPKPAAASQLKLETPNGNSIRFGLLVQPAYQVAGSTARNGYSEDLFIRRTRILIGGSVMGAFDYFFDTDFAYIGLATNTAGTMTDPATMMPVAVSNTRKTIPGLNIQDVFVTWKSLGDPFKVDVGYMLPPLSHNAVQGATTLFGWDYFQTTFLHNAAFGQNPAASATNPAAAGVVAGLAPVGRDVGVQLRGLVAGGMLEYRVGAFQGIRSVATAADPTSSNAPRFVGRLQLNLMDAEPGFFYAGTYFGKKKIVSIGGSIDYQKAANSSSFDNSYHTFNGDVFVDLPVGPGVLTAQVDYENWHGGAFVPTGLPKNTIAAEAGYTFAEIKVTPIVRYEQLSGNGLAKTQRYAGGIAFWPFEHNVNLKLFYSRIQVENAMHGANQVNAQLQLFYF